MKKRNLFQQHTSTVIGIAPVFDSYLEQFLIFLEIFVKPGINKLPSFLDRLVKIIETDWPVSLKVSNITIAQRLIYIIFFNKL